MTSKYNQEPKGYTMSTVMQEAARCLLCEDAPCSKACPAHTNPAKFIRSVRFRNVKGAAETIRENNALGAICARVCPTERYCEKACTRAKIDGPIDISGIQRYVTDMERKENMQILHAGKDNGMSVAIIGSGPAGLQAATTLRQKGYAVDIYEKQVKAGGYLTYGIPEYRLPEEIVDYEVQRIVNLGAKINYNVTVGKDITMDELKAKYNAVIVAIGASAAKTIPMFEHNICTESAISFLARAKENKGNIDVPDNVLVIGGGDVAMDVVTTLKKLDVPHVTDVVYEEFDEFRASKKELAGAQKAGVTIIDGYEPKEVHQNRATFKHRKIDSELTITADKIILAVGQKVDADGLDIDIQHNEIPFREARYHTKDPKVFATGDIVDGDKTVVVAVQKGKEVAEEIDRVLGGQNND
ncbi:dihydropyrimidine dehydrogenase [Limosilactobacillus pontis]|uniref:dihydrouracil dehydrogenase (NAD(+)) n=1 Tax=Limosilactobacillus pontis TaxID=35787 RepID=A0A2J6NMB4_9LACO|nr:FAD-dependent oxidoreductase [Limosilactobacillus pontis]PMB82467.1 dihydropyrimidine dehydrogenase [Limosilactobacillus pontis]